VSKGVGVEHSDLLELAKKYFSKDPTWVDPAVDFERKKNRDVSIAQYRGGKVEVGKMQMQT